MGDALHDIHMAHLIRAFCSCAKAVKKKKMHCRSNIALNLLIPATLLLPCMTCLGRHVFDINKTLNHIIVFAISKACVASGWVNPWGMQLGSEASITRWGTRGCAKPPLRAAYHCSPVVADVAVRQLSFVVDMYSRLLQ